MERVVVVGGDCHNKSTYIHAQPKIFPFFTPGGVVGHGAYCAPPDIRGSGHDVQHCAELDPNVSRVPPDPEKKKNAQQKRSKF